MTITGIIDHVGAPRIFEVPSAPLLWINIVRAMAHQENGQTAGTMNDVIFGYVMAFEDEVK